MKLEAANILVFKQTKAATVPCKQQSGSLPAAGLLGPQHTSVFLFFLLLSAACSSECSEQLTKALYHKTLQFLFRHSIKVR